MSVKLYRSWIVGGLLGIIVAASAPNWTRADDEQAADNPPKPRSIKATVRMEVKGLGSHWLGLMAVPVDEALKSHLKLSGDRLMIQEVVPESPAAKAGLKPHDVLLKYGQHEVTTLESLMKAVEAAKDQEQKLEFVRQGQPESVNIQSVARPADRAITLDGDADVSGVEGDVLRWFGPGGPGGPFRLRMFGPAIALSEEGRTELLPDGGNLSIRIQRENDQPAKIAVEQDGQKWEVSEQELDKLPEDVREHVKRLLGQPGAAVHGFRLQGAPKLDEEALKKWREAMERDGHLFRLDVPPGGPFEKLHDEMLKRHEELLKKLEAMQRQMDKLHEKRAAPSSDAKTET